MFVPIYEHFWPNATVPPPSRAPRVRLARLSTIDEDPYERGAHRRPRDGFDGNHRFYIDPNEAVPIDNPDDWPEVAVLPRIILSFQIPGIAQEFDKVYELRVDPDELTSDMDPVPLVRDNSDLFDDDVIRAYVLGAEQLQRRRDRLPGLAPAAILPESVFSSARLALERQRILAEAAERERHRANFPRATNQPAVRPPDVERNMALEEEVNRRIMSGELPAGMLPPGIVAPAHPSAHLFEAPRPDQKKKKKKKPKTEAGRQQAYWATVGRQWEEEDELRMRLERRLLVSVPPARNTTEEEARVPPPDDEQNRE